MSQFLGRALLTCAFVSCLSSAASAQEAFGYDDWYLTLGASGFLEPTYPGDDKTEFRFRPIVSIGHGKGPRFVSQNDSASLALFDSDVIRAGLAGRFVPERDEKDSSDLRGLGSVKWGLEAGGFLDIYATDWLRGRLELRQGIRAHDGLVADFAVDAFTDIAPRVRISGGPRVKWASSDFTNTYYGVSASQSLASGLSPYNAHSGVNSVGVGGAITWKATDRLALTSYAEYSRLQGDAADSPLVRERGSRNQYVIGISATYTFCANPSSKF